ncbi:rho guanine nucleotide exchange factor 17-like [Amphibalanus amphitrite]|uniref:rho guanine nucleotide exchange factor 17-like n=1 Tax=Amphibalanus amphitrite TaxID=1232801 RepID=UPI001C921DE1|nr:rho guanine nucleotide exchange factor 17-like [Amphibalanus amphitrite]
MAPQTTGATTDAAAPATAAAEAVAAGGRPKLRRPLLPGSSDSGTSGDEPREPRFADLSPVIITHGQVIESPLVPRARGRRTESLGSRAATAGSDDWQRRPTSDTAKREAGSRQKPARSNQGVGDSMPCQQEKGADSMAPQDEAKVLDTSRNKEEAADTGERCDGRSMKSSEAPARSLPLDIRRNDSTDQSSFLSSSADDDRTVKQTPEPAYVPEDSRVPEHSLAFMSQDSECLPAAPKGQFQNLTQSNDQQPGERDPARNIAPNAPNPTLDDGQETANPRPSLDSDANQQPGRDDVRIASWDESQAGNLSSEHAVRSAPPLMRQNATGRSVSPFDPANTAGGEAAQGARQEQDNALKLSLDHSEPIDESTDKENIRQAVKKAVALLLNELNVDEDQEDPWYPGQSGPPTTQSFPAQDDEPQLRRRRSTYATEQPESKTVDVVRLSDTGLTVTASMTAADHWRPPPVKVKPKRFRSKSLSPSVLRRDLTEDQTGEKSGDGRRSTVATGSSRLKPRSQNSYAQHRQRSFDLSGAELRARDAEPRRRSFKKRPASKSSAAAATLSPSTDSVSSTSSDEQRVRGRGRSSRHNHSKLHSPRLRTVSDSAALRPLSAAGRLLPLTEQTAAQPARRRHISPSPLAYDSEPDGPGRTCRRRLRGPYGELLEGKMSRAEATLPLSALVESASPSPSPRPGSRRGSTRRRNAAAASESAAVTPRTRSSGSEGERSQREEVHRASSSLRLPSATPCSDGELPQLPGAEQELTQLLSEALYDGVGPTARRMLAQVTSGQDQPGVQAQGRRVFIIGELLDTEQRYVESLRLLVEYHERLNSADPGGLIDSVALEDIFQMIPEMLEIHEGFLADLTEKTDHWSADQGIGEVFLNKLTHSAVLETYAAFVNHWPEAREALRLACQTRPELAKTLEALERADKRRLSLTQLLIAPVQRIPRYELLLKQLVSHTPEGHPDLEPLKQASEEIHQLASRINSLQRAPLRGEARRQALRELEAAVDGLDGLVTPDREFLRSDLVTMTTPAGIKKERCLFLFGDLLVVASIKRRAGSASRKQTPPPNSTSTNGMEPNKYKFLMKIPLTDISIERDEAFNPDTLAKEVERIDEDISTLRQMGVLVCKLHSNHHQVEELVREMAHVLSRELTERHRAESQLLLLPLQVTRQEGIENITVSFNDLEKRMSWEQLFNETKQKLAERTNDRRPIPSFLRPLPVRKTRAGLQFSCAAPTPNQSSEGVRDIWVCNSDGYVGQICTLSLRPEPSVTSCNGVCNSRILCIEPVPAASSEESTASSWRPEQRRGPRQHRPSGADSSSDSELSVDESTCSRRGVVDESTISPRGTADEAAKPSQATMWIGTEDGCIYVYNCSDYVRVKKTTVKTQLGAAVTSLAYLDDRVFVGLGSGAVSTFARTEGGCWNLQNPQVMKISSNPINKLAKVHGKLWVCTNNVVKVLDPATDTVLQSVAVSGRRHTAVQALVCCDLGVWMSFHHTATIRLFNASTFQRICEVDVTSAVTRMLSGCDSIIRQHKTACLRVTSLMVCKELLWIGSSAGVLLNLPLPPLASTASGSLTSTLSIAGVSHGHTGHVRFLAFVESSTPGEPTAPPRAKSRRQLGRLRSGDRLLSPEPAPGKFLVVSGGDGYEDFRSSGSALSGRDDSTNHLLLWSV